MDAATTREPGAPVTRREAVRALGVLAAGVCGGCAPVRLLVDNHASTVARYPHLEAGILHAFVATVVPGAPAGDPNLVRAFYDRDPPYAEFERLRPVFVGDLCRRAERGFGTARFDRLEPAARAEVLRGALQADDTTKRLYAAAVYLTQVTLYSSAYTDSGCPLIDFEGAYGPRSLAELTHPHSERFLPRGLTREGNPA